MKRILPLALLLPLLGGATCQQRPPVDVGSIAADCLADPVRDLATHLLDDVASALIVTGDWRAALANVAVRAGANGWEAVKCAVERIFGEREQQLTQRARMDEDTVKRLELERNRAALWLEEHE